MADEKFIFDSLQDSQTITEFLRSLTEGFQKGTLTLSSDEDAIELTPTGLLNFTVKAKKKADRSKVSITIAWKSPGGKAGPSAPPLKIE